MGSTLGLFVLRFELVTGRVFWRCAGERGARSTARRQRVFLRAAMDEFPTGRRDRNSGLVHDLGRRTGLARIDDAWRVVGAIENERAGERAREKAELARLVGRGGADGGRDSRDISSAAAIEREFCCLAVGLCVPAA